MKALRYKVEERFALTARGTALVIKETTGFPAATCLRAIVYRPDGTQLVAEAFKDFVLQGSPAPLEREAFVLRGVDKNEIPHGCYVEISAS